MKLVWALVYSLAAFALRAQDVPFIKTAQLEQWKNAANDTVFVLNFWATWCAPCVEELPSFEKVNAAFGASTARIISAPWPTES